MSTNKNAILRYNILDRCFRNPGKRYFIDDLLNEVNQGLLDNGSEEIQKRQLQSDIAFMESEAGWAVPLLKIPDGKKKYYRYEDLNFSINNQPLNEEQINHIESALTMLASIKGMPQFDSILNVLYSLKNGRSTPEKLSNIMEFSSNEYLKGIEYLGPLFNAIYYNKIISISYHSFKSAKSNDIVFHPYLLKQYNNRWFLFGMNADIEKISVLALDRIKLITELVGTRPPTDFDPHQYFEDIVGVSRQEESHVEEVLLRFSVEEAPYILTKPLHGSQRKVSNDASGLVISLELILNQELLRLLLGFGSGVEVLKPQSLRENIKKNCHEALEYYNK